MIWRIDGWTNGIIRFVVEVSTYDGFGWVHRKMKKGVIRWIREERKKQWKRETGGKKKENSVKEQNTYA